MIASFDIGKKNFAYCVQDANRHIILYDCVDLTVYAKTPFIGMYIVLDKYKTIWDSCDVILVEQQMAFGRKINLTAIKLAQHCLSYFIYNYGCFKDIIEFPAYHKTRVFDKSKMTKPQRKKWAIIKTLEILEQRQQHDIIEFIESRKKKDDLADCFLQIEAYRQISVDLKNV